MRYLLYSHGFASLVTAFGQSLSESERVPLIYFLVLFPVLVLSVFAWFVSCHAGKLYPPGDYRDDSSFLQMLTVAANLGAAKTSHPNSKIEDIDLSKIASTVRGIIPSYHHLDKSSRKNQILWVDDRPENNVYERGAFEAIGLSFSLAQSTKEALQMLEQSKFAAVISDMGRREGPQEGYVLLEALRNRGDRTPFFIYAGSNLPEHKREADRRGAQGSTNNPQELFELVTKAVIHGSTH